MVNAYTLTFAVLLITGAALGDRFGRKRVFLIGMAIFIGGSALAALSPSTDVLILARAIQGVGGAIVTPLTLTILSAAVPPERRAVALGRLGRHRRPRHRHRAARRRRDRRGPRLALDLLAQRADRARSSSRWPYARLTETYGPEGRLDIPGLGLISAGLLALVWGVINGNDLGWSSPQVVGVDRGRGRPARRRSSSGRPATAHPMLPLSFFRSRAFSAANARLAADVLRDVRVDLPARPVLPGRPGLQPVPGRPADAAVDGDADHRRPDRGRPRRPDRRTADPRHRHGAPGRRPRLAGRGRHARRSPYEDDGRAVHPGRHRDGPVLRPDRQRRPVGGPARAGGQGVGRHEHDPRGRRRVRGGRPGRDLQRERRATRPRPRTSRGCSRRSRSARSSSGWVPSPRWPSRRGPAPAPWPTGRRRATVVDAGRVGDLEPA